MIDLLVGIFAGCLLFTAAAAIFLFWVHAVWFVAGEIWNYWRGR